MKRINNLYSKIYSIENLQLADVKARKGKLDQPGVINHAKNAEENILKLHYMLKDKRFKTSPYTTFKIREPKVREIYRLPFFPDRITHHAVMNVIKPVLVSTFTADSYSCIEGKGIHAAARAVKKALRDEPGTRYCLKLDVRKFYPSIDHDVLKRLLRRKFKDNDLLWLLDGIIDSAPGLPIGNYLSQYFANFYLSPLDHHLKEVLRVENLFRYLDDMVILADNKPYLHHIRYEIQKYLSEQLKLQLKGNYQVFPVKDRGIDFVGYVFLHECIYLRKSTKQNFARMMARNPNQASIASYYGWAAHCDSKHLLKKLLA